MPFLRIRKFLRSVPDRLSGVHVSEGEQITRLSSKAKFLADEILEARIALARDLIGHDVEIKGDRKLIEEQPDGFKRQINYDDWL